MSKVGDIFAKLNTSIRSAKKTVNTAEAGKNRRVVAAKAVQKGNRDTKIQKARGIQIAPSKTPSKTSSRGKGTGGTPVSRVTIGKRASTTPVKGKGKKGTNGKAKGKRTPKKRKETSKPVDPADPADLDKQMDTYWFKAGKGPDPEVAKLDNDMDAYFQNKSASSSEQPVALTV